MKERGILFSAPMVRAILAGAKTQTRRLITNAWWRCLDAEDADDRAKAVAMCPHGRVGDRLWVRETWGYSAKVSTDGDERRIREQDTTFVVYRADEQQTAGKWRPSLHMPRWASRITLVISSVRVERLRDISETDARAEGCTGRDPEPADEGGTIYAWKGRSSAPCPRAHFSALWDQLNAKRAPWSSNPWVWVVDFKRVESADGKAVANA